MARLVAHHQHERSASAPPRLRASAPPRLRAHAAAAGTAARLAANVVQAASALSRRPRRHARNRPTAAHGQQSSTARPCARHTNTSQPPNRAQNISPEKNCNQTAQRPPSVTHHAPPPINTPPPRRPLQPPLAPRAAPVALSACAVPYHRTSRRSPTYPYLARWDAPPPPPAGRSLPSVPPFVHPPPPLLSTTRLYHLLSPSPPTPNSRLNFHTSRYTALIPPVLLYETLVRAPTLSNAMAFLSGVSSARAVCKPYSSRLTTNPTTGRLVRRRGRGVLVRCRGFVWSKQDLDHLNELSKMPRHQLVPDVLEQTQYQSHSTLPSRESSPDPQLDPTDSQQLHQQHHHQTPPEPIESEPPPQVVPSAAHIVPHPIAQPYHHSHRCEQQQQHHQPQPFNLPPIHTPPPTPTTPHNSPSSTQPNPTAVTAIASNFIHLTL